MKSKIKFIEDVEVKDHNGDIDFTAKKGEVKELEAPSARRWIRRNKAELVVGSAEPKPRPAPTPKKKTEAKGKQADEKQGVDQ